jgi:hypothetical protein
LAKSKKPQNSPSFELSIDADCLQRAMGKCHNQEIISFFQLVIRLIEIAGDDPGYDLLPPQIWPHLPALLVVSLLRFAAFAIRIIGPSHALHHAGSEFSVVRMKEHDA